MAPQKPRLGPERRDALGILADAPDGLTEGMLLAHGVEPNTILSLVSDGLATTHSEKMRAGGQTIQVTRVKITEIGRRRVSEG